MLFDSFSSHCVPHVPVKLQISTTVGQVKDCLPPIWVPYCKISCVATSTVTHSWVHSNIKPQTEVQVKPGWWPVSTLPPPRWHPMCPGQTWPDWCEGCCGGGASRPGKQTHPESATPNLALKEREGDKGRTERRVELEKAVARRWTAKTDYGEKGKTGNEIGERSDGKRWRGGEKTCCNKKEQCWKVQTNKYWKRWCRGSYEVIETK